jgi:hypothetical protein
MSAIDPKAIEAAANAIDDTYDVDPRGDMTNIHQVATAAITAYLQALWQPIETAPNGFEPFMVWCDALYGEISGFREGLGFVAVVAGAPDDRADPLRHGKPGPWYSGDGDYYATWNRATHWQPRPDPPVHGGAE